MPSLPPPPDTDIATTPSSQAPEDEEDDDADFNPPSPEASSSLSSESDQTPTLPIPSPPSSSPNHHHHQEEEEEDQEHHQPQNQCGLNPLNQPNSPGQPQEQHPVNAYHNDGDNNNNNNNDNNDNEDGDNGDDDEDAAICTRTRARYSLANFTLDELETFLQETDDEDDLPRVDDQDEYRKFLSAVLLGRDASAPDGAAAGGKDDDDDDEENDADFEIEIEEALMESEVDEGTATGRPMKPPETRQKKQQMAPSAPGRKKLLGQAKTALRPLLPSVPSPCGWARESTVAVHCSPPIAYARVGFTAHQIGQLHCLIHEHVQLLIQVYTLCVFESSKQHIKNEMRRMLLELVRKRDEALASRETPYPGFCFRPPFVCPSVSEEHPQPNSSCYSTALVVNALPCNVNLTLSHQAGATNHNSHGTDVGTSMNDKSSAWMPVVQAPVMSILDVAPLSLVGSYIADVSKAMQVLNTLHHTESASGTSRSDRKPLFPHPFITSLNNETHGDVAQAPALMASNADPIHSVGNISQQQPKKSLAATLVENTKKQSVAPVPRTIAELAQRFYPCFNVALFPHKPPPPPVANRVLFTDAEDGLLAMGLMEYNNDWKAIQQRFLPCKSKHQIFVRQKNRSSSKAPENPIKAVRRIKTSPLTAEEKARINEGLKIYKLDWLSVWKYFVPHRDPSLLPRQWRIAHGMQKSYKTSEAAKAKRRVYESMRRKSRRAAMASWPIVAEKEVDNTDRGDTSADGNVDDEGEAYVHEAFLAEWAPRSLKHSTSELLNNSGSNLESCISLPQRCTGMAENWVGHMGQCGVSVPMHGCVAAPKFSGNMHGMSQFTDHQYSSPYMVRSSQQSCSWKLKSTGSNQGALWPSRMRKNNIVRCVKLAPDLPPVNLPPSVRVISQSAFRSYQCQPSLSKSCGSRIENPASCLPSVAKSGTTPMSAERNRNTVPTDSRKSSYSHNSEITNKPTTEENNPEPDLQMHPLLFQAPEDGCLPYSSVTYSNTSNTFNFILGTPLKANLDLVHRLPVAGPADCLDLARSKEAPSNLCTIDFHPLLQRADDANVDVEIHESCAQVPNCSSSVLRAPVVINEQCSNATLTNPYEKVNELDLDIHLSSASARKKVTENRGWFKHRSNEAMTNARELGITKESQREESRSRVNGDKHVMDGQLALSSNFLSSFSEANLDEQSNPGIVMEQEELSDSDEDVEEDVEFECEEMVDSEGEGADCGQLDNLQNKEVSSVAMDEELLLMDKHGGGIKLKTSDMRRITVAKSRTRTRKSVDKAKNLQSSVQGQLDSCAFESSSSILQLGKNTSSSRDTGNVVQSTRNRSCKRKPMSDHVKMDSQDDGQPCSTPVTASCDAITFVQKPRKRGCRMNIKGIDIGNSKFVSGEDKANLPDNSEKMDGR